jgi:6,7-dimethyl-8-ribityllumazine synthase
VTSYEDEEGRRIPYGVAGDDDEPLPLLRTADPVHDEPPAEDDDLVADDPAQDGAAPPEAEAAEVAEAVEGLPVHAPGDLRLPDDVVVYEGMVEGARRTVGIVVSRYNGEITNRLLDGAMAALEDAGVTRDRLDVMAVPGAFELPLGAMALAKTRRYSCVVAVGCVIRGDTPHFDYVCSEAASGLQLAGLETGVPVAFGVLTCDTEEQAEARAGGEHGNKGAEAARSALEMADVFARLRASA